MRKDRRSLRPSTRTSILSQAGSHRRCARIIDPRIGTLNHRATKILIVATRAGAILAVAANRVWSFQRLRELMLESDALAFQDSRLPSEHVMEGDITHRWSTSTQRATTRPASERTESPTYNSRVSDSTGKNRKCRTIRRLHRVSTNDLQE